MQTTLPWRVVAALGVTQIVHWGGLYYAFAVLMPAIEAETGWSRATLTGAFSASLLAQAAVSLIAGIAFDRIGTRICMTFGSVMASAGLFLAGQVDSITALYAVWIFNGVAAALTQYEAAFAAVAASFGTESRRGISVLTFAGGLASTIFWPLTALLLNQFGWRDSFTIIAILNLGCTALHALFLPGPAHRQPVSVTPHSGFTLQQALRLRTFWLFAAAMTLNGFLFGGVSAHLVPALAEKNIGGAALLLATLIGPMQVSGRVLEFTAGQRVSLRQVGVAALAAMPVAMLFLALGGSFWVLMVFVVFYGAGNGVITIVRGALPVELFGRAQYGTIAGAISTPFSIARAAGPVVLGAAWGMMGGYTYPLLMVAGCSLLSLLCFIAAMRSAQARV